MPGGGCEHTMNVASVQDACPCSRCGYNLIGLDADGRCPECGAAVSVTLPRCPRCPSLYSTWLPLRRVERASGPVWECERCGGLGFDRGALSREIRRSAIRSVDDSVHDVSLQASASCGRCISPMTQITIDTNTVIDRCEGCGFVWIDFGELPSVVMRARRELAGRAAPPQLDEWLGKPDKLEQWRKHADARATTSESVLWIVLHAIFGSIG